MLKGYHLASPGAIIALLSFFLPWFVVSGCQGDTTTVSGVDAVKLMADSSTGVIYKLQYSVPALVIPLLALFVLFMAGWAWGRGRVGKRDIMTVTGSGVMLTLILAWYLFLLRDTILQIRYGFGGELFAAALLLMGGLLNWQVYQQRQGETLEGEIIVSTAPSTWKWTLGTVILASACMLTTGLFFPNETETPTSFSDTNSTTNNSYTAPILVATATPAPQQYTIQINMLTPTEIYVREGQYVWIQANGSIKVGPFIGYVDPDGKNDSFLTGYSLVSDIPHGALICRFRGYDWAYCGSEVAFQSNRDGYLDFDINDNDQGNNTTTDYFNVTVIVSNTQLTIPQSADTANTSTNSTFTDSTYESDNTSSLCDPYCGDSDGDGTADYMDDTPYGDVYEWQPPE